MGFIKKSNAQLFLFLNAFLWGSSYVWSKMLLGYLPRFPILLICAMGGLLSTVVLFRKSIRSIGLHEIVPSVVISSFSILSNTFFMLALQYTGSSNTAFIVQTSVVITPVLMALFEKRALEGRIIISSVAALLGLFLMTCEFENFSLNAGDLLALGNAVFFSLFLAGLRLYSKRLDPVHFTFIHYSTNTLVFFFIAFFFEMPSIDFEKLKTPVFVVLAAASSCIAVVTTLIQSSAIKFVRAEKATLIYTLEPVTTLLIASVLIGERLEGVKSVIGCILILVSVIYASFKHRPQRELRNSEGSPLPMNKLQRKITFISE